MRERLLRLIRMNRAKLFVFTLLVSSFIPTFAFAEVTFIDRVLAAPFNGLITLFKSLGFKSLNDLVFNLPNTTTAPFTSDEWNLAMYWYHAIEIATGGLAVVSVIVEGYRIMAASGNPSKRADAMEKINLTILAYAVIWFLPMLSQLVFMANAHLTELFKNIMQSYGSFSFNSTDFIDNINTGNVLADAIVRFGYIGLMMYFNFLYTIRKFVLIAMLVVTPIAVWGWGITGHRQGLEIVVSEIVSNAFMQASHALALCLYTILISKGISSDFSTWWAQIFGMVAIIPTTAALRNLFMGFLRWLGVNEEGYAGMAMGALSSLGSIASIASAGFKKKSGLNPEKVSGSNGGVAGSGNGGNGTGGGTGGGTAGGGIYGGQEVPSDSGISALMTMPKVQSNRENMTGVIGNSSPAHAVSENSSFVSIPSSNNSRVNVPGQGFKTALSTASKISSKLSPVGHAVGTIAGAAMGLPLGAGMINNFAKIGSGVGSVTTGAAGGAIGTVGSFAAQTIGYKYATDDPNRKYVDESGNGLIKGVQTDDGMMYYMPDDEGYADIQPSATFATEAQAYSAGYRPYSRAGIGDRIKNITGSEHPYDGAGKMIGATLASPLGTKAANIGGNVGEGFARGTRKVGGAVVSGVQKGYQWIKNISDDPDNFRWKQ
ncbi:hypothetical protein [Thermoanaerobacterium sp. RBIITD]|uniref:sunset domain-containing protein n=1 Tax=Thermoanaerobacterium sp. RBIITD TaxID=1550240 RepID=UPI000BC0CC4A|nr:hypothetical protein [Thermoanaerobacterium sp. RBIITD]SNX54083.1 hypothetical protein SAMN05660242_1716 [Thermoanaerobacterium sp. RBIITD]